MAVLVGRSPEQGNRRDAETIRAATLISRGRGEQSSALCCSGRARSRPSACGAAARGCVGGRGTGLPPVMPVAHRIGSVGSLGMSGTAFLMARGAHCQGGQKLTPPVWQCARSRSRGPRLRVRRAGKAHGEWPRASEPEVAARATTSGGLSTYARFMAAPTASMHHERRTRPVSHQPSALSRRRFWLFSRVGHKKSIHRRERRVHEGGGECWELPGIAGFSRELPWSCAGGVYCGCQ